MSKYIMGGVAALLLILSLTTLWFSFGWYLMIFLVLLIPSMFFHISAIVETIRRAPKYFPFVLLSGITFLVFSGMRPDNDFQGDYTGYSSMKFMLDYADSPYVSAWAWSLEATMLLLLIMVYLDLFILYKIRKQGQK